MAIENNDILQITLKAMELGIIKTRTAKSYTEENDLTETNRFNAK